MIAAIGLVVLVGTVFAIPTTRAEVLSWLSAARPEEYLTSDDEARAAVPELHSLVSSPAPQRGIKVIPIDRADSKAVNSEKALAVSDFLYENCDVALGDAMFDGEDFYQAVHLYGLSGLYLLDSYFPGTELSVPVDPNAVSGLYENGPGEEYLTGEQTWYEQPTGWIWYELPNGKRWRGEFELPEAEIAAHRDAVHEIVPPPWNKPLTEEQQQAMGAANRAFLERNGGLTAVAHLFYPNDLGINNQIDENGDLTVRVLYQVSVTESDEPGVPDTDLFWAELGTITIRMYAADELLMKSVLAPEEPVVWDDETLTLSTLSLEPGGSRRASIGRYLLHTDGLSMRADTAIAGVNALGIRGIRVRIDTPSNWTDAERTAFAEQLWFEVLFDGQAGSWYLGSFRYRLHPDGSILWSIPTIDNVPYSLLKEAKTITLIPTVGSFDLCEVTYADGTTESLNPAFGEIVESLPGVVSARTDERKTAFSAYAITLTVVPRENTEE